MVSVGVNSHMNCSSALMTIMAVRVSRRMVTITTSHVNHHRCCRNYCRLSVYHCLLAVSSTNFLGQLAKISHPHLRTRPNIIQVRLCQNYKAGKSSPSLLCYHFWVLG